MGRTLTYTWNGLTFEYDEEKSRKNVQELGRLPFTEAYKVWENPFGEIEKAPTTDEERYIRKGYAYGQIWFCVYTPRDERYRIVSFRVANEKERR